MILMFNKTTFEGHWFRDGEDAAGWTEKVPPGTAHAFDEGLGDWVRAEPEPEED